MTTKINYFITSSGINPVKEFIDSLESKQKIKAFHILKLIIEYGINSIPQHIKKLSGTPLWEIEKLSYFSMDLLRKAKKPIQKKLI